MDGNKLQNICNQVYRKFPEVKGAAPKVSQQKSTGGASFLVLFRGTARSADGKSIPRTVRVVASEDGQILKMSTSR